MWTLVCGCGVMSSIYHAWFSLIIMFIFCVRNCFGRKISETEKVNTFLQSFHSISHPTLNHFHSFPSLKLASLRLYELNDSKDMYYSDISGNGIWSGFEGYVLVFFKYFLGYSRVNNEDPRVLWVYGCPVLICSPA